jgi:hypothetical protein
MTRKPARIERRRANIRKVLGLTSDRQPVVSTYEQIRRLTRDAIFSSVLAAVTTVGERDLPLADIHALASGASNEIAFHACNLIELHLEPARPRDNAN